MCLHNLCNVIGIIAHMLYCTCTLKDDLSKVTEKNERPSFLPNKTRERPKSCILQHTFTCHFLCFAVVLRKEERRTCTLNANWLLPLSKLSTLSSGSKQSLASAHSLHSHTNILIPFFANIAFIQR